MQRVGLWGATGIGAGAMLGAGVFAVWGPATADAGHLLVVAVAIAGVVATVNALSTAQLAAHHPVAGGAYTFGRREIHPVAGFIAGIGFVVGKTASIAAIALTVGAYVWPAHPTLVATGAIIVAWALNARGVTRTAAVATTIAIGVVLALAVLVFAADPVEAPDSGVFTEAPDVGPLGVLSAAALIFFAFAGYARIATLGEEVHEPARTIPRAIMLALGGVILVYVMVATALLNGLGAERLAASERPVAELVEASGALVVMVTVVASIAAFGSLVALMAGVGRTAMAMAREADLPRVLANQSDRGVPWVAEAASGLIAIALAWYGSLGLAIAASSCAVLIYYAVANASAFRARRAGHVSGLSLPLVVSAAGVVFCVVLVVSLPWHVVVATASALLVALALRAWVHRGQE